MIPQGKLFKNSPYTLNVTSDANLDQTLRRSGKGCKLPNWMELIADIMLSGLRSTLQSALATSISPICPCCRIPHRRLCHEVISVREGVSGEIMSCSTYNFDKLEPAEARTNASKIKGPARVVAHGKQYWPREKCLAKVKVSPAFCKALLWQRVIQGWLRAAVYVSTSCTGRSLCSLQDTWSCFALPHMLLRMQGERKKRNKCCVMDSRYTDPTLVDPELPSSWKARQVAVQLSDSDDVSSVAVARGLPWPTADRYMSDGQRYFSPLQGEGNASSNPSLSRLRYSLPLTAELTCLPALIEAMLQCM